MGKKFLRLPQVKELTGFSRSSIYAFMARGEFPQPYHLAGAAGRAIGWLSSDIEAWMDSRVRKAA